MSGGGDGLRTCVEADGLVTYGETDGLHMTGDTAGGGDEYASDTDEEEVETDFHESIAAFECRLEDLIELHRG